MKTIVLSDHIGDRRKALAEERDREYDAALQSYKDAVKRHEQELSRREQALVEAFRQRQVWRTILGFFSYVCFLFDTGPRAPALVRRRTRLRTREETLLEVGREGEQRVAALLGRMLGDEWMLLTGYCNPRGEIDQILVGPLGVFALEIKNLSGQIHCQGDVWWRDKYDSRGRIVQTNLPVTDRTGRGPSVQVNTAADCLQQFLNRTLTIRIVRAVIFAHDRSRMGTISNQTVEYIAPLDEATIKDMLTIVKSPLDATQASSVVALIERDHKFHEKSQGG